MLQGPDLPLSPPPEGEPLDPSSTLETSSAPGPSPPRDTVPLLLSDAQMGEEMVLDARAGLTPAQMVERKVITLLKGDSLPISCTVAALHNGHTRRRGLRNSGG